MENTSASTPSSSVPAGLLTHQPRLSPSQRKLLDYLQKHPNGITRYEGIMFLKIPNVNPRITELEKMGFKFKHVFKKDSEGQRYTRYILES
jgi:DNA-binding MarR family transcriptional regulator